MLRHRKFMFPLMRWKIGPNCFMEFPNGNYLINSVVGDYFFNLSTTCDFLPSAELLLTDSRGEWIISIQQLKEMFVVPRLNKFHQTRNRINKFQLVQAFLSFLLQLLYHKTHPIVGPLKHGIENLEKELRFLLTILGDISWMLCHTNHLQADEFQNLLPEFEAVANQAGSFVHYLFFSDDRTIDKTDEGIAVVLKHAHLLKANLQSSVSIPAAYTIPTTSIVDSILIFHSLVDDLEDLLERKDDPIADVKDQVIDLHRELLRSHSSINDMRSPKPSEIEEVKEVLMRIGGIAHQAEYLVTSFVVKDAPHWYVFKRLTHLNQHIELMRTELQVITQKCQLESLKGVEYCTTERSSEVNDVIVGFEDITTDILDQLVGGGTQSLQVISILGMPGLGKTTLANKLYNHPFVCYRFDKLAWCVVSQTYKKQSILANILIQINSELAKNINILNMEEISLVEHIHKTLIGRRYLIVLDDIWDSNVSDELLRCFPNDGNGSRVLLTSRNKDVAPPNSMIHELPLLSDEQCWELLQKKVFGSRTCPLELQGIGKKIAARCYKLPLTVVVIAGVLSTVDEKESTWEEVGGSLGSYIDGEDNLVMQILELSYMHLPDHLKSCFLYFGEFKEDEKIPVGNLKRLWVAEGFIRKEKGKSAENIAGEYLMELINRNLIMVFGRRMNGRGVKSCVVHDLFRDLCMKKSKEENFIEYLNNDYHAIYEKGHRVRVFGETETQSYCQHVRSFVGNSQSSSFYVRDMRLLRVLHCQGTNYNDTSIIGLEYLVNLRFLVIYNLPTWIDRLVNLECVRVTNVETYLPPAIVKMKKLKYLRAKSAKCGEDCSNSNQTNNLEYLSKLTITKLEDEELLKCFPYLRKLKCYYDLNKMGEKRACPHFDLGFLTQLDSLSLFGFLSKKDFGFPSKIRKLTLNWSGLPWEKMSIVGRLGFLESLNISSDSFVGERWDTRDDEFQKLKCLELEFIDLCEWNVASKEHFPKLQRLILTYCKNLKEIPSEIGEIATLELIEVKWGCAKSVVESAERIKEEQLEMGNEDLRVIIRD